MSDEAWPRSRALTDAEVVSAAAVTSDSAAWAKVGGRMPAIYLGHGAPPLLDDALWVPSAWYAHPTVEHFAPLFVALGASDADAAMATPIAGFWLGLSKRSVQFA
jgi:aromatic ring-opening dioxygenase catalytic subunit (LigB family)